MEPPKTPLTPPPTPETATPKKARRKSGTPKKLEQPILDDPEMPPLREIIPKNKALVSLHVINVL